MTDMVAISIPAEALTLYTSVTLQEEEMTVRTPSYSHILPGSSPFLPINNGALRAILSRSGHMIGSLSTNLRRPPPPPCSGLRSLDVTLDTDPA